MTPGSGMAAASAAPASAAEELEGLLARLDTLAWRLDRGECPSVDGMDALAVSAQALGPRLSVAERRRLSGAVAGVTAALERACEQLRERIVGVATGRRAVRAYAGRGA